jgi:hypothetical protein
MKKPRRFYWRLRKKIRGFKKNLLGLTVVISDFEKKPRRFYFRLQKNTRLQKKPSWFGCGLM